MTGKRAIVTGVLVAVVLTLVGCDAVLLRAVEDKIALEETGPPTPGGSGSLTVDEVAAGSVTLSWQAATDDIVDASDLSYQIVFSIANNIATVETAELNGTIGSDWKSDVTSADATGLSILTEYYFNVIVRDLAGNKAIYVVASATTQNDTTNPTPGANGLLTISDVAEESLTVSWAEGSDDVTSADDLEYGIFVSELDNISTVAEAQSNGTQVGSYSPKVVSANITGLTDFVTYYVNVLVRDGVGNLAAYTSTSDTTVKITRVFWTEPSNRKIRRAPIDDSADGEDVIADTGVGTMPYAIDLDVAARKMYWTDDAKNTVLVSDMDGSNTTTIILTGLVNPRGIAVDAGTQMVYWSDRFRDAIYAAPVTTVDGDAAAFVILDQTNDGVDAPLGVSLDLTNSLIYWVEQGLGGRIRRAELDGSNPATVYSTNVNLPHDLFVDPSLSRLYYTDEYNTTPYYTMVARVGTNGSGFADIIDTNLTAPIGITVSGTTVFWTDYVQNKLYAASIALTDGDADLYDFETIIIAAGNPAGIAIDD